jgi:2-oxo-4-hydroxy-4-carboxy-5-ureidoimidazoline decarboxylase
MARDLSNKVLSRWNFLAAEDAAAEIHPCCGSSRWSREMASARPIYEVTEVLSASDTIWRGLSAQDWDEAFQSHPRIGGNTAERTESRSAKWSADEQARAAETAGSLRQALTDGNREYEKKFRRIFIICASEKSTTDILADLRRRLENDKVAELLEAAEQQRQITQIRLKKWLTE